MGELYYRIRLGQGNVTLRQESQFMLASIPVITHSTQNRDRFSIPLRDGELLGSDIWRGNAYINCIFHTRLIDGWGLPSAYDTLDKKIDYLVTNCLKGEDKLWIDSRNFGEAEDPSDITKGWKSDGYFEIKGYSVVNEIRKGVDYVRVEIQFEVYPYRFKYEPIPFTSNTTISNLYDDCMPLYQIDAVGFRGQWKSFAVNGKSMQVKIPDDISRMFVDTRRQIAYYNLNNGNHETPASGDFTALRFKGLSTNTITSDSGVTVTTYPRWGWKI